MRVATVGLFVTIVVLAVNVARLALPSIRAQSITVVPYTVVLAETIVAPDGRRLPGPHQMWAVRSDGAVVLKFGSAGTGSRQIRFASGVKVSTNDKRRAKSSVQTPLDDSWVRDPREKCVRTITGFQRSDESASGEEILNGYRTVEVAQFDASRWYALDYGCALVKHRVDHGELGSSELDLVTLIAGEPSPTLFAIPSDYVEGPPSSLAGPRPVNCTGACGESQRAHFERLDASYYRHRVR